MKTTPFTETHIALGAKMHEFAGYNMPIEYSGIIDEHLTVCNAVGVFDVSHMGEFWVLQTMWQLCPSVKRNILVSLMRREVLLMTCWYITMNPKNTCWW